MNEQWIELVISNIRNNKGMLISILEDNDTLGIEEQPNKLIAYFSKDKLVDIQTLSKRLKRYHPEIVIKVDKIENQDWHLNWKDKFKRVEVTDKFTIVPVWQKNEDTATEKELYINPGMAFGTGVHETTQLALELLEKYIQPKDQILDAGCGSGILTIAALKLGAAFVEARDITTDIQDNFHEQMDINNITAGYNLEIEDITQKNDFPYDLIISNIQRTINTKLLKKISNSDFDGIVIFTGLLKKEENEFISTVSKYEKDIIEIKYKTNWFACVVN